MVDRFSRDQLALLLRRYLGCRITNDELADEAPYNSEDPGIQPVYEYAWHLYDDLSTHRAEGKHALSPEVRRMVTRWIVFLHGDHEYRWPPFSFLQIYNWPLNLLTLGCWERRKRGRFEVFRGSGQFKVWPFFTMAEYKAALSSPRFLAAVRRDPPSDGPDVQPFQHSTRR